jgi:hypothetical protein
VPLEDGQRLGRVPERLAGLALTQGEDGEAGQGFGVQRVRRAQRLAAQVAGLLQQPAGRVVAQQVEFEDAEVVGRHRVLGVVLAVGRPGRLVRQAVVRLGAGVLALLVEEPAEGVEVVDVVGVGLVLLEDRQGFFQVALGGGRVALGLQGDAQVVEGDGEAAVAGELRLLLDREGLAEQLLGPDVVAQPGGDVGQVVEAGGDRGVVRGQRLAAQGQALAVDLGRGGGVAARLEHQAQRVEAGQGERVRRAQGLAADFQAEAFVLLGPVVVAHPAVEPGEQVHARRVVGAGGPRGRLVDGGGAEQQRLGPEEVVAGLVQLGELLERLGVVGVVLAGQVAVEGPRLVQLQLGVLEVAQRQVLGGEVEQALAVVAVLLAHHLRHRPQRLLGQRQGGGVLFGAVEAHHLPRLGQGLGKAPHLVGLEPGDGAEVGEVEPGCDRQVVLGAAPAGADGDHLAQGLQAAGKVAVGGVGVGERFERVEYGVAVGAVGGLLQREPLFQHHRRLAKLALAHEPGGLGVQPLDLGEPAVGPWVRGRQAGQEQEAWQSRSETFHGGPFRATPGRSRRGSRGRGGSPTGSPRTPHLRAGPAPGDTPWPRSAIVPPARPPQRIFRRNTDNR